MRSKPSQSGSSLLLVILITTTVSVVILATSKLIIDTTRSQSAADYANLAKQMALSGIEEGLARYNGFGSGSLLKVGEYGNDASANELGTSSYRLKPMRRGFYDADCLVPSSDTPILSEGTVYNSDCPYYDLTVRSIIRIDSPDFHTYTSRELPPNQEIILNILQSSPFNFTPSGSEVSYRTFDGFDGTGSGTESVTVAKSGLGVIDDSTIKSIAFTTKVGFSQLILTVNSGQLAIGKGFTTIDVSGYAGSIRKKYILTIREKDGIPLDLSVGYQKTTNLLEFAQSFDERGLLQ